VTPVVADERIKAQFETAAKTTSTTPKRPPERPERTTSKPRY